MLHFSFPRPSSAIERIRKAFHSIHSAGFSKDSSISEIRYFSLTPIPTYKSVGCFTLCFRCHVKLLALSSSFSSHPIIYQFQLLRCLETRLKCFHFMSGRKAETDCDGENLQADENSWVDVKSVQFVPASDWARNYKLLGFEIGIGCWF